MLVMVKSPTQLKLLRGGLSPKVSQEEIARGADITLATYRNAEGGKNVSYSTATAILRAINTILGQRGKELVTLDSLGLHIV